MKVYTDKGNFQTLKLQLAARLTATNVEFVEVKHNDCVVPFLVRSKLPALEWKEGEFIFSVNTAAKYIFLKTNKAIDEEAENAFLDWENSELLPVVVAYLLVKKDKTVSEKLGVVLRHLDSSLAKTKFLTGSTPSVSDVCVFGTLTPLLGQKNCDLLSSANIQRWCQELNNMPDVHSIVSEFTSRPGAQEDLKASLTSQTFTAVSTPSASGGGEKEAISRSVSKASATSDDQVSEKVTQEELDAALKAWQKDSKEHTKPRKRQHPVLPEPKSRNILITSALPYVNNVPHLGNIIGCVLSGDVFSRYCRLRNYNPLYICGTDEYGTATETKAMQEGLTPREICDKYNKLHAQIYKWFNIDFDYFGRTTTEQQTEIAQDIFWKLHKKGFILKDSIDQLQCTKCNKFLADRFVEGTCPLCGFEDARGDQCDGCGKLLNATELVNPKCKMCKASPVIRNSHHLFVDLPKLEPLLKSHLDKVFESGTWTNNARVITNAWIRDGLKPRCISRDLKWGTPVPLEGYTEKVFYVWYDAPIGYISATANYTDQWQKWWKNPEQVEMYNFLGKDNVPFHSVIFPSCLLGADDGYTVVKHMCATEYLNYEDTKFSKSRNTGVFGDQAESTGIPADVYRFYLLYLRPETQDTAFSWDDFVLKNNSELLNNLGNFINRALSFLFNIFDGTVQQMDVKEDDLKFMALVTKELQGYVSNLEACRLRDGVRNILSISKLGNQYMQANKPWVLAKGTPEERLRAGCVVSVCVQATCLLSVLLQPYMPLTSATIQQQLQAPDSVNVISESFLLVLPVGHKISKPSPLFQRIESSVAAGLKEKFAGKPAEQKPVKQKPAGPASSGGGASASPEEVERLTKAVADQGTLVRELKTAKADPAKVSAEVATLLQLKKDLASAQGGSAADAKGKGDGGKGKKKGGGGGGGGAADVKKENGGQQKQKQPQQNKKKVLAAAAAEAGNIDAALVERLTKDVAEQGLKVREVKAAKADKAVIDAEVASLLQLKRELAVAQGLDPEATVGGGGKKNKKK